MYDFHTHFIPIEVQNWLKEHRGNVNAKWINKEHISNPFLEIDGKWGFELKNEFTDLNLYKSTLKTAGITTAVASPIPQLFMYDFDVAITKELSETYNESLLKIQNENNSFLYSLATLPLNNPEIAANMLEEYMQKGMKGAIIGPGYKNHMLSDDYFTPIFEVANETNAILFIHPLLAEDPRLKRRRMPNLIGVPWETTVCATDILLSGLIDKYNKIKILFAHGGGFLPYQIGRINKGSEMWDAVSSNLEASPLEYMKRFFYDTTLWNKDTIQYLTQIVGEEQVVPGSDFPFDLSVWPPIQGSEKAINYLLK